MKYIVDNINITLRYPDDRNSFGFDVSHLGRLLIEFLKMEKKRWRWEDDSGRSVVFKKDW